MKGFTLIELLVVLGIILILAGIIVASLPRFHGTAELGSVAEHGISLLLEARAKTLSSQAQSQYGVHFEVDRMVLFKGGTFVEGSADNSVTPLSSRVEISSISLNGGGSDVVFNRLTGATDQYGTLTLHLVSDPTQTRTIRVLGTGGISLTQGQLCEWALFSEGSVSLGSGSVIKSYHSGGGGADDQARVQTNSTAPATFATGTNVAIRGTVTVGQGGDPNSVISLGGGSFITGGTSSASSAPLIPSAPPPGLPSALAPIDPPPTSGTPIIVGSGGSTTVNVCSNTPSEITTGTNTTVTLNGDCPLTLEPLSLGSGSNLVINGNVATVQVGSFATGTNTQITFPSSTTITASSLSVGSGSSFIVEGNLYVTTPTFATGTNVTMKANGGNGTFLTNSFSLGSGDTLTADQALAITAQTLNTGTNVTMKANGGNGTISAHSFSLGSGSILRATQDLAVDADTFTTGTNVTITSDNALRIHLNSMSIGSGSQVKSTTDIPKNFQLTAAGSTPFSTGTNVTLTGILYAPASPASIGSGSVLKGSMVAASASFGTNISLQYDLALSNEICTP